MGPIAICDTCGKPGWDCHAARSVCWHCSVGLMMHRKFWTYVACTDCGGSTFCDTCRGAGVIATPREEVTASELLEEYTKAAHGYQAQRYPVPEPVIARIQALR